jgi:type II secretion system protein N
MKKVALVAGAAVWFGLVFVVTFWMTFPSDTLAERLKYEVQEGSAGAYQLQVASVRPWWVGLSGTDVELYNLESRRGEDSAPKLLLAADKVRVRVGLLSWLLQTPTVSGGMVIGGGDIAFELQSEMDKRERLGVSVAKVEAREFPFIELLGLAGIPVDGSGVLDLEIDIEAPDGMRQAEGKIEITGTDLLITEIDPSVVGMDLGMEIPLDDIEIVIDITQGKAEISRGRIRSSKANVDLDGSLILRDDLSRSSANIGVVIELGEELAMFSAFLKDAKGTDDKFHYQCSGSLSRAPRCSAKSRSSVAGRSGSSRSSSSSRGSATTRPSTRTETSAEDRERRREEIRERLRQRREGAGSSSAERPSSSSDRGRDDEDEEFEDEEFEDEDEEFEDEDEDEEFEDEDEEFD